MGKRDVADICKSRHTVNSLVDGKSIKKKKKHTISNFGSQSWFDTQYSEVEFISVYGETMCLYCFYLLDDVYTAYIILSEPSYLIM